MMSKKLPRDLNAVFLCRTTTISKWAIPSKPTRWLKPRGRWNKGDCVSVRTEKVASIVKEEIGVILQRNFDMKDFGLVTVTEVRMSPDLKIAKVFVSVFGDAAQKQKSLSLLEGQKSFVRQMLGRNVRLKF